MARRYGLDGQRQWNGKAPEDFTHNDVRQFIADTDHLLYRKENTTMATQAQTQTAAPPTRDADSVSVSAKVYPIKNPMGNVLANAAVNIDGIMAIRNIRVMNGQNGLFIGLPREKDGAGQFKDVAYPIISGLRAKINDAVMDEFIVQIEKNTPARISDQLDKAGQEAAKANAARSAPDVAKAAPAHDGR
jgi:stage V sporulation protein G